MISNAEIKKRLNSEIDRQGRCPDFERVARYTVDVLVPAVAKLIKEEATMTKPREKALVAATLEALATCFAEPIRGRIRDRITPTK